MRLSAEHGANGDCADGAGELGVLFGGVGVLWEGVAIIYKGYVTRSIITGNAVRCRPRARDRRRKASRRRLGTASPPLDAEQSTSRPQYLGQPWRGGDEERTLPLDGNAGGSGGRWCWTRGGVGILMRSISLGVHGR